MDAAVAGLQRAGYQITWRTREIGGYPFRMDVTLTDLQVREPSGWGLVAPRLEAEAYAYSLGHWILAAPEGLTFDRPEAGPVKVSGQLIRAGLFDFDKKPPSFDFEGVGLAFQPLPGAHPFALSTADRVEFHLRGAAPLDEGLVALSVDNGKARLAGLFARIAGDKPISIVWTATLSKMSGFSGSDWASAVRNWADAGGQMRLRHAEITAGDALLASDSGALTADANGRLRGTLSATLRQAPRALGAMSDTGVIPRDSANAAAAETRAREAPDQSAHVTLDFQNGRTKLGPVAIGPAPKVYEAR
jgi:hypothetical protein